MNSVEAQAKIRALVSDPDLKSAGISPEVAVRLQRLAFERVTDLMC